MKLSAKCLKRTTLDKAKISAKPLRLSLLALAVVQGLAVPVMAATIEVNNSGDSSDVDQVGTCNLRQALRSANEDFAGDSNCVVGSGQDTITFANSVVATGSISLTFASLSITEDLVINGPTDAPLVIDGAGITGVFDIANATVSLNYLTISGGSAADSGGGIKATGSTVSLNNVAVSNNSASNSGAGIYAVSTSLTLSNSTVSGNSAANDGGGIFGFAGSTHLINSTVSNNSAVNIGGGVRGFASGNTINLSNSIIAGNSGSSEIELSNHGSYSTFITDHSLLGDSSHTSAQAFFAGFTPTPGGNDIVATSDGSQATDVSAIIKPLSNNGGVTPTHALVLDSPALSMGNSATCAAAPISSLDQRGLARNLSCDIGSFEFQPIVTITVNSSADTTGGASCTLRDAIISSNTNTASGGCAAGSDAELVLFDASVSSIGLTMALPTIASNVVITGSGQTIDANKLSTVLIIDSSQVTLNSLTITGGSAMYGGGVYAQNSSNVSISDCTVSGNTAFYGAGILAAFSSNVSLNNCTVSGNTAANGGGIYAYNISSVSLNNSSVMNNYAAIAGAGLRVVGSTATVSNSVLTGGNAKFGGGLAASNSVVTLNDMTIENNSAVDFGGGVRGVQSSITINNSTISGNSAADGGGISLRIESNIDLNNSTVSGNSASATGGGISKGPNIVDGFGSSTVNLLNSTIANNMAATSGGGIYSAYADFNLANTIVAGNVAPSGAEILNFMNASTFTANNSNLFGDRSHTNEQAFVSFVPGATDINANSDTDGVSTHMPSAFSSILAPLTLTGGPTKTHALMALSPALNAGDNALCAAPPINNLDQRGKVRPLDDNCDIGAHEGVEDSMFFVIPIGNGKSVTFSL